MFLILTSCSVTSRKRYSFLLIVKQKIWSQYLYGKRHENNAFIILTILGKLKKKTLEKEFELKNEHFSNVICSIITSFAIYT